MLSRIILPEFLTTYDWPEDWPDLLPFLPKLINDQTNINGVHGALRCLLLRSRSERLSGLPIEAESAYQKFVGRANSQGTDVKGRISAHDGTYLMEVNRVLKWILDFIWSSS